MVFGVFFRVMLANKWRFALLGSVGLLLTVSSGQSVNALTDANLNDFVARADDLGTDDLRVATSSANTPDSSPDTPNVEAALRNALGDVRPVRLADVTRGELLFYSEQGLIPAPQLAVDVNINVTGMVARVLVTQQFTNPTNAFLEAVYVFPLPEDAAVDQLVMQIGERRIEGVIQRREDARAAYEQAREAGQRASLVEQERPNMFTTSLANLAPGETINVEIGYLETLRYDQNAFSMRFPFAITPRYIPGTPNSSGNGRSNPEVMSTSTSPQTTVTPDNASDTFTVASNGWAQATDHVPDAPRITPPVASPGVDTGTQVTLSARIDAGFPLANLESRYHDINQTQEGDVVMLELADAVPADRDVLLTWTPNVGSAPETALFQSDVAGATYALMMVMPPQVANVPDVPREVIYIIDTSGSMAGTSIEQAREALLTALDRLESNDRFNVIEFNDTTRAFFRDAVPATAGNIRRAKGQVVRLNADGGTEMSPALARALSGSAPEGYLRQVVFMTDGSVGNETALFAQIRRDLGGSRLFTVGIGSAPNAFFMRKAAEFGRGTYTYIGDLNDVQGQMQDLFSKLENPVITNLNVQLPESSEAYPATLPDLYLDEPVVMTVRLPQSSMSHDIVISGNIAGDPWQRRLLGLGGRNSQSEDTGLPQLWARDKIDSLSDDMVGQSGEAYDELEQTITQVALDYTLVSDYTSLVAIDTTPVRPEEAGLERGDVLQTLPAGQNYDAIFGYPNTATPALRHILLGMMALLLALVSVLPGSSERPRGRAL